MRVLVLVGLMACFEPSVPSGAPCDDSPTKPCPSSQSCVAGTCEPIGTVAPVDGTSTSHDGAADRDGDGVPDDIDNCPDVANADQANEDGDRFGDVCDPCPVEANDNPSDPDGDGVADGCDPHPTTPGDKIALFEGFAAGIPVGWQSYGNVTAGSGEVSIVTAAEDYATLVPPLTGLADATLSASLTVDQGVGSDETDVTVALPYDVATTYGIFCELYGPNEASPNGRYLSLYEYDAANDTERGSAALAWTTATPYRTSLTRTASSYTCSATPPAGSAHTATGSTGAAPTSGQGALWIYGAEVHVQWVMVVTSP